MKKKAFIAITICVIVGALILRATTSCPANRYKDISYPTPNIEPDTINEVHGVVLHHTAETESIDFSLELLTSIERKASAHVVIDYDGTRYILAAPTDVTWHAGRSILHGREECNFFTIGIEFQGNTLERPLTQDQIDSAIEYLLPIIREYDIPLDNIATHQMVRRAFKQAHPDYKVYDKPDITQTEYGRFMHALRKALKK